MGTHFGDGGNRSDESKIKYNWKPNELLTGMKEFPIFSIAEKLLEKYFNQKKKNPTKQWTPAP